MAFNTAPGEDYNFRVNGWTTGGSTTSAVNGIPRTQDELLNHAASHPYPNDKYFKAGVKDRLTQLRQRYHDPNWHKFLSEREVNLKNVVQETNEITAPQD